MHNFMLQVSHFTLRKNKASKQIKKERKIMQQVSHGMLATRYHLPPPQVTADNNDQPQLVDAEEVK